MSRNFTVLIADDEPHLARALQTQLKDWPQWEVVSLARNGLEAAERIASLQPDVAFLDIQMPGLTGLEVAQGIEGGTRVVFVTAYDEYAVQAFEQEVIDYLLKPVKVERLAQCMERLRRACEATAPAEADRHLLAALQRLLPQHGAQASGAGQLTGQPAVHPTTASEPLRWIRASRGEVTQQIPVAEVLYFHADDKYTCVQTATSEHLIRTPISELAAQLDPATFWQIHRATIVNLQHIEATRRDDISRLFVRIKGCSTELPVSRAYVHLFKAM